MGVLVLSCRAVQLLLGSTSSVLVVSDKNSGWLGTEFGLFNFLSLKMRDIEETRRTLASSSHLLPYSAFCG